MGHQIMLRTEWDKIEHGLMFKFGWCLTSTSDELPQRLLQRFGLPPDQENSWRSRKQSAPNMQICLLRAVRLQARAVSYDIYRIIYQPCVCFLSMAIFWPLIPHLQRATENHFQLC